MTRCSTAQHGAGRALPRAITRGLRGVGVAHEYEDRDGWERRGCWRIGAPEQSVSVLVSAALRVSFLVLDRTPSSPGPAFCVKLGTRRKQIENEAK